MTEKRFNIPIARPTTTGEEAALMQQALESGWVSMGPLTQQFEQAIAEYTGAKYAIAVNSCTSAIHVAMLAYGIGAGDDVICPSYSFIASANGVRHSGAEPRFADIDPATLNICPVATEALIQSDYNADGIHKRTGNKLKAIMVVHQIGIPADIDAFAALAKKYNMVLLEDNACGLGSTYKGKPLGVHHTNMLSFHPRKVITSGEGGMLLTNDERIAEKSRVLRAHGMSISDLARHNATSTTYESYEVVGYNYRLTDLQSAVGIHQMKRLEEFIARRIEIAERYNAAFSKLEGLSIINPPTYVTHWNYQSYPLRIDGADAETRNRFMQLLDDAGIATRRGIPPIHQEPVYEQGLTLPHTEAVSQSSMMLPIFPARKDEEVAYIIEQVGQAAKKLLPNLEIARL